MHPDFPSARHVQHFDYRPAIDGLRGIAVLAVLGFHAFSEHVPGGFVGVDVFFVISGFLITDIIARQLQAGQFSFADFYARRIRRLFPALVLVLVVTLILGGLILLPHEFERLGKHIAAAALFVANFAFWRETGYFDVEAEFKPLLHLWSLGIEEQFYLLWPALLVLMWSRRSLLKVVLSLLVIGSFVLSVSLASVASVAAFYLPVSRFWELGIGCLLALAQLRSKEGTSRGAGPRSSAHVLLGNVAPAVGLALIGASIFLFDESMPFPSWRALLPAAGALLILWAPRDAWLQRRVLASPVLVYVGLISYALYLWHWPMLSFASILQAGPLPNTVRWIALLLSFALAVLTYHFIEVPVRRRKELKVNVGLATGAAIACLAGVGVYAAAGMPERFDVDVLTLRQGSRIDRACRARFDDDSRINYCKTASQQPPNILVLGDSRAQAIYEAVEPMFAESHSVMLLARGGCPPILDVRIRGYDPNERDCEGVWRTFVEYAQQVRPHVVILVGNGSFLMTRPKVHLSVASAVSLESKEAVFEYGLRSLMAELTRSSHVIHIGEIPEFDSAPSCFLRPVRLPTAGCTPSLSRQHVEAAMSGYNAVLERLNATFPSVLFVNSVDLLCTPSECSQRPSGGPVLYSDKVHLSPAGGRLLAESSDLRQAIESGLAKRAPSTVASKFQ